MPMMSDLTAESGKPPMILPPLDIEWVWFCHTLNPASYRHYCDSRFSKLIGKAAILTKKTKITLWKDVKRFGFPNTHQNLSKMNLIQMMITMATFFKSIIFWESIKAKMPLHQILQTLHARTHVFNRCQKLIQGISLYVTKIRI